jgi:hypothetical protein
VAHTTAGRRSLPSDEADNWQVSGVVSLEPSSSFFFSLSTNLSNHNNALGLGVNHKSGKAINEVSSIKGITTNTDNGWLTQSVMSGLVNSLVSEGAWARHDTDLTLAVDVARHNTNLALTRLDDTRAVRSNQAGLSLRLHDWFNFDHIESRDTFSNAHNKIHLSFNGFEDSVGSEGWGHIDDRGVSTSMLLGISDVTEDWESEVLWASLLNVDSSDHFGSVSNSSFSMESTVLAGHALADDLGMFVDEDVGLLSSEVTTGRHSEKRVLREKCSSLGL